MIAVPGFRPFLIVPLALLLTACSGQPPNYFRLSPDAGATPQPAPGAQTTRRNGVSVGVGPITIPEYLDRAEIVTRDGPTGLQINNLNRWGGNLSGNFQVVLGESLSRQLGTDRIHLFPWTTSDTLRYQVLVQVNGFEAGSDGIVTLDARWTVLNPGTDSVIRMGRSVLTEPLTQTQDGTPDYSDISAAMSRLVTSLGAEIARSGIR
ncbi:MAG: hypothetical protein CML66_16780 [Rhodobacteraceae bacterium]|nr:hypothetical protein [Paracoccaceae bacterium]